MTTVERYGEKPLVMIESPYAAPTPIKVGHNVEYARRAMLDSINRGEAPFAGHLLYTQVLDDYVPRDRRLGISLHMEFLFRSELVAIYQDLGITSGMQEAIDLCNKIGKPIEYREINI